MSSPRDVLSNVAHPASPVPGLTASERAYRFAAGPAFGALLWMSRLAGAAGEDLAARRGLVERTEGAVWIHGASAGEIRAGASLRSALARAGHHVRAVYTTTNAAGLEVARGVREADDLVSLAPWDAPRWVARAFDRWTPRLLVLIETELWPSLVAEASARRVPVVVAGARIYPRDVSRYRWIAPLVRAMLQRIDLVLAQNEVERARFAALGADPTRCRAIGSLKHLATADARPIADGLAVLLRQQGPPILVAGSVHDDELDVLFAALDELSDVPWRCCVAPRHPSAIPGVEARCEARGWTVRRRSTGATAPGWRVLLLDRMGELEAAYASAWVAIVGGGFGAHGGHNPLEPLRAGVPFLFGPNMEHFAEEAAAIRALAPETVAADARAIAGRVRAWLPDGEARRKIVALQAAALPDAAEVAQRYVAALSPLLARAPGERAR